MRALCPSTLRRAERGSTLLMAMGFIAVITVGVLVGLRSVTSESGLQGQERRSREAFFAAEAGLAEGREMLRLMLGTETNRYTAAMLLMPVVNGGGALATVEVGHPSAANYEWLELIPLTAYTLSQTGATRAVDPSTTTPNRELRDANGNPYRNFPEQEGVSYQVFVQDDEDDVDPVSGLTNRLADSNGRVWLVSVGQVASNGGGLPTRAVVRALVTNTNVAAPGNCYGQKGGCSDNSFAFDSTGVPDVSSAVVF